MQMKNLIEFGKQKAFWANIRSNVTQKYKQNLNLSCEARPVVKVLGSAVIAIDC